MYVHSVVLKKCVGLLVAIFWNSEIVYILPNPKLEKFYFIFFYTRFKQAIRLRFTGISSR